MWVNGGHLWILGYHLLIILPYCGPNEINHFFCEVPTVLKLACVDTSLSDQVNFILGFILLLVLLFLIIIVYISNFAASHITMVTMFSIPFLVM